MSNVVSFPVIPRLAEQAPRFEIPVPVAKSEKERQMEMVRGELAHAVRKLLVVAECNNESATAIELLQRYAAAAKAEYGIKESDDAAP